MMQKLDYVTEALSRTGAGESLKDVALDIGVAPTSLGAWMAAYKTQGTEGLASGKSTGRRPQCEPDAEQVLNLRQMYVKTNRAKGKGSQQLAARLYAGMDECSEDVKAAIMKPRKDKRPPKCIRDVMTVAPAMFEVHRNKRNARLNGLYVPGNLRMTTDEHGERRRLRGGERQSWDEASINFMVVVPWPQGGCRLSDKFGVKLGRYQLLAGIDDATSFCPGYSFVIRELESYRSEDTVAAQYRVWRDAGLPDQVVVEGGVWQSNRAMEFYRAAGVVPIDAKGRPQQKLVENYWGHLWTILSTVDGQIGRYRGEMKEMNDLLMRCKAGRLDPRKHFVELPQALASIDRAIAFRNEEPIESKTYGRWVPAERYEADLAERPSRALDQSVGYLMAPVRETRTVTRDLVKVRAASPLGEPFTYAFSSQNLWEYKGRKVQVYFDPYDAPPVATIVLAEDHGEIRKGTVIATDALCLDNAPTVRRMDDAWAVGFTDVTARAVALKKQVGRAKMTEYRALGIDGKPKATQSEYRDRDGNRIDSTTGDLGHGQAARATLQKTSAGGGNRQQPGRVETQRQPASSRSSLSPTDPAEVSGIRHPGARATHSRTPASAGRSGDLRPGSTPPATAGKPKSSGKSRIRTRMEILSEEFVE